MTPDQASNHLRVVEPVPVSEDPVTLPSQHEYAQVHVDKIRPNPYQPRKIFGEKAILQMAEIIKKNGEVEEDVTLALYGEDDFVLINGERRWRATKEAGLKYIQAKIRRDVPESMLLLKASVANFCVVDLNIIEKAKAIENIMNETGWNQTRVSEEIGLSQGTVSNILKALFLHDDLQELALKGEITPAIIFRLAVFEKENQLMIWEVFQREVKKGGGDKLSVNKTNRVIQKIAEEKGAKRRKGKKKRRRAMPHFRLISRSVNGAILRLLDDMNELSENILEQPGKFQTMEDPTLTELLRAVEDLQDTAVKLGNIIEKYV